MHLLAWPPGIGLTCAAVAAIPTGRLDTGGGNLSLRNHIAEVYLDELMKATTSKVPKRIRLHHGHQSTRSAQRRLLVHAA